MRGLFTDSGVRRLRPGCADVRVTADGHVERARLAIDMIKHPSIYSLPLPGKGIYTTRHSGMDCRNPESREGDANPGHKSRQSEFDCSNSRIFAVRDHVFSCFSRKIALSMPA
jgi:hypothetical protein